jgi:hypothetical protein
LQPTVDAAQSNTGQDDFMAQLESLASQTADPNSGTCLSETDTSIVPNNIAGYGIVNAYEVVKMALARP